jgi:hypothetical protein
VSDHGVERLPQSLRDDIELAIDGSRARFDRLVAHPFDHAERPLAIKFMSPRYGGLYTGIRTDLEISTQDGFTWGTGVYVTPLRSPISSAIYGRAGVVCWFDPAGWRIFDCTEPEFKKLYLRWLAKQPMFEEVLLTVHSNYLNHLLRDEFRKDFSIHCVLFHPDEWDRGEVYTSRSDVWMAVGEFDDAGELSLDPATNELAGGSKLRTGSSAQFHAARLVVVLEEEFVQDKPPETRSGTLRLGSPRRSDDELTAEIVARYDAGGEYVRVLS